MRFHLRLALAALLTLGTAAMASAQSVVPDKQDYAPGETATFTGSGFAAGEEVRLIVHHADAVPDTGADHNNWTVVADENGGFVTPWHVCEDDCIGATLQVNADGLTSGLHAEALFTDAAQPGTVTVSVQGGTTPTYGTGGGTATYTVTVTRLGTGGGGFNTTLSVSGLPAGASGSFSPNPVAFGGSNNSLTSTLTITTTASGASRTPAGSTTFTVSASGGSTPSNIGTLLVNKRAVEVSAAAKNKVYGDSDPPLTYSVTSGSVLADDSFSGALTRGAGESVGSYSINQGTLTLSANYALTYKSANLTIGTRAVHITADAKSKTYGNGDPAFTYAITLGSLAFSDGFSGALVRTAGENVGSYAINQGTVALSANYVLTYVGANLTIGTRAVQITADAKSKTYGDTDPSLTYAISSGSLAFSDVFSGLLARAAGEDVGSHAIEQGTVSLSANYALTYVGADLAIGTRAVTVTADAKSKTYGDSDPALSYGVTSGSLAFSDGFSGGLARAVGENVGSYAIGQGTLALGSNYALTYVGADLSVGTRAVTVTADAKSKTYGDSDPALSYGVTSGSLAFSDGFAGALARAAGENVGSYAIGQGTLALGSNYALTYVGADLSVGTRAVTVTADAKSKTYGDSDPALSYGVTSGSLAFSDGFSGGLARAVGENVGSYAIGQGTVALSANYVLTYVGADLTIGTRPVQITAAAKSKTYGDADPALTYTISSGSLAFSDGFAGALARAAGENVGSYAIGQGTVALSANYVLTYVGADLTIGTRPVQITAAAKSKTYGDADPALTYTISSGSLAFSDGFAGALARAAGENVGSYAIGQGTVALSANYALTFVGSSLTIGTRPVTVTADAKTKIYGTPDPALTFQITTGSLAFSDAFAGALSRTPGEIVLGGGYSILQNTLSLSSNYVLSYVGASLGITPASTATDAGNPTATFGDANVVLTANVSALTPSTAVVGEGSVTFTVKSGATTVGVPVTSPPVSGGVASAAFSLSGVTAGSYSVQAVYTPGSNFFGSSDATPGTLALGVMPTASTLTVSPSTQQYSDAVTLTATLSPSSAGSPALAPASTVTFYVGSQNVGTVPLAPVSGVLRGVLPTSLLEPTPFGTAPIGQMAPGPHVVTAVFGGVDPNFAVPNPTPATLTITPEDARPTYTGALFASTSGSSSSTATVTLSATIQDITATADAAGDASFGDIRNAKVTFINRDNNTTIAANLPVGLVSAGDTKTGTATYNWSVDIGSQNSQSFTIGVIVTNYYTRNSSTDNTVVTVSKPLADFITGGGYLVLANSSGLFAGAVGSKNNFGFNVKYNKSNTNLQGNINTIIRNGGRTYQVKGNSMTSLAVTPTTTGGLAVFNGKASIQDITNPLSPVSIDGNATLQVNMTDAGEPGSSDLIGITVWNKSGGLWFASNWDGVKTVQQLLGGGNLQAKSSSASKTSGGGSVALSSGDPAPEAPELPAVFGLAPNAPNPFVTSTTLRYTLPRASLVTLAIFDVNGREVARLVDGTVEPGYHSIEWAPRVRGSAAAESGVYFLRMQATPVEGGETFRSVRRLIVVR